MIVLGIETDTFDSEGIVVKKRVSRDVSKSHVENVINKFEGELLQTPPMYSALKYKGKPLYKLARKGINIERSPRNVSIYEIELLQFREKEHVEIDIFVHVSKGTYIRSLAKELGNKGIRVNSVCPVLIKTPGLIKALKTSHSPAKKDINISFQWMQTYLTIQMKFRI